MLFPLPAPYATTRGAFQATSVSAVAQRPGQPGLQVSMVPVCCLLGVQLLFYLIMSLPGAFLYKFPANIVGFASVNPGHVSGPGNLTLVSCHLI